MGGWAYESRHLPTAYSISWNDFQSGKLRKMCNHDQAASIGVGMESSKNNLLIGNFIAKLGEFLCPSVSKRAYIIFFKNNFD